MAAKSLKIPFLEGISVAMATVCKNREKARRHSLAASVIHMCAKFHQNRTTLNGRSASTNRQTNQQAGWRRRSAIATTRSCLMQKKTKKLKKSPRY